MNFYKISKNVLWCSHGVRIVFANLATDLKKGVTDYGNEKRKNIHQLQSCR